MPLIKVYKRRGKVENVVHKKCPTESTIISTRKEIHTVEKTMCTKPDGSTKFFIKCKKHNVEKNNEQQTLDDFEREYNEFIEMLKKKKEEELKIE